MIMMHLLVEPRVKLKTFIVAAHDLQHRAQVYQLNFSRLRILIHFDQMHQFNSDSFEHQIVQTFCLLHRLRIQAQQEVELMLSKSRAVLTRPFQKLVFN